MKEKGMRQWAAVLLLAMALLAASVTVTSAQSGGVYRLTWNTYAGGGGESTGGVYALNGTVGQPDGGRLSSGSYTVLGGFWTGISTQVIRVFLPMIRR